jgi:hypothetical protein
MFSSYLTENIVRLQYKGHSFNALQEGSHCLLSAVHETRQYSLWKTADFLNAKTGGEL